MEAGMLALMQLVHSSVHLSCGSFIIKTLMNCFNFDVKIGALEMLLYWLCSHFDVKIGALEIC
jgi:hypothetical protein